MWYLITVLARCLINARSYATYLICIHSFDLPWNSIRNFNSLYRKGNWGTEKICDLFEVGRGWSHLTLEPVLLSPAVGKELGNTKCGGVSSNSCEAADPPCDRGIIYPTALNKGYHKFYPSTFPNGLRCLFTVLIEHLWETMGYLYMFGRDNNNHIQTSTKRTGI